MLGDLASDFLRIQLVESQVYDPFLAQQDELSNPDFLGYFTLTIAEVISRNLFDFPIEYLFSRQN